MYLYIQTWMLKSWMHWVGNLWTHLCFEHHSVVLIKRNFWILVLYMIIFLNFDKMQIHNFTLFSREKGWNLKCFHSFREVKSEMKISFTHFENEKWNENVLRSRSRMKSEIEINYGVWSFDPEFCIIRVPIGDSPTTGLTVVWSHGICLDHKLVLRCSTGHWVQ